MSETAALAVVKKVLKPYKLVSYHNQVKLMTNPNGSWDTSGLALEKGWVTLSAGWLIEPKEFARTHPRYCLFSKMEQYWFSGLGQELVEAWLYTPDVRSIFANKEDRDLFRCFVEPRQIYEIPLL